MNEKVGGILARLRHRLETLYADRLVRVMLFGSQARGDAKPDSDIDVLVVLLGPVRPAEEIDRTLEAVSDLSLEFDQAISCFFLDEEYFTRRNGPFLRNVRREGIVV